MGKRYVLVLKLLRPAPLLGGTPLKIEGLFMRCQISLVPRSFWSTDPVGSVQMVGSIPTAYLLAHWAHLHSGGILPDWGEAAHLALEMSFH